MRYNYLPGSNVQVSIFSLGTMMFGGQTSEADSMRIMDYAFEQGVNFFDTANGYNQGESERIVGKGLKGRRHEIILATKVSNPMGNNRNDQGISRRNIFYAVDESLRRLDTDYIDIYYLHAPDYRTELEESVQAMADLARAGKICYFAVSNFSAWQMADILAICDKRGYRPPVLTQSVYNLITRGIETELVPFLTKHKMGMAIYNPIAAGLLTGKHQAGKPLENTRFATNEGYYRRYFNDENLAAVEKLTKIAADHGMNLLELAMRWCAAQSCVTSIITGVSRLEQLAQNLQTLDGEPLSQDALQQCDEVWHALAGTRFQYFR
jgi:1-deoxyxylulose-5-phosphate synthase